MPAMRRTLRASSCLPGLRPLQRPSGDDHRSYRLIFRAQNRLRPSALFPFMRIAIDVMGGDHGCGVVIDGVKIALNNAAKVDQLFLVGKEDEINSALRKSQLHDSRITVVHATEVLTMEDKPIEGLKKKKDCSIL